MAKLTRSCLACVLVLSPALLSDEAPKVAQPTLARQLVRRALVRDNDLVQIAGPASEAALLEDLAVEAARSGANPLVTLTGDRLRRRLIEDVPAKFDARPPRFDLALAGLCDVFLGVEPNEDALLGLPPSRMATRQKALEKVNDKMLERGVRTVWLGNGLYPTPPRAKRFGMTVENLRKVYEAGLAADGAALTKTGEKLRETIASGKEMRLRSDDGTDLTLRIARRPVLVSDGVLTAEKVKKGGAACMTWLPAGEVYVTPVPGSGDGVVVAPHAFWEGEEIRRLKLTFKAGKLTAMTAESGLDRLEKVYRAHGEGKDALGAIDVGLNPGVRAPTGSKLVSFVAEGTVTVALGNNAWAGGDVNSPFGLNLHLPGCTLTIDGRAVVEKGRLR
ncbi:MAG: aminopeptidase [Gemmataceae bacterium]